MRGPDLVLMRVVDIVVAFPFFVLVIALVSPPAASGLRIERGPGGAGG